jgi:hypothetical protein
MGISLVDFEPTKRPIRKDLETLFLGVEGSLEGRRCSAVCGFENEADASKAATRIKRVLARGRKWCQ